MLYDTSLEVKMRVDEPEYLYMPQTGQTYRHRIRSKECSGKKRRCSGSEESSLSSPDSLLDTTYSSHGDSPSSPADRESVLSSGYSSEKKYMHKKLRASKEFEKKPEEFSASMKQTTLLKIAVRTLQLQRQNQETQQRIAELKKETYSFIQSVLGNPENKAAIKEHGRDTVFKYLMSQLCSNSPASVSPSEINLNV